MMPHAATNSSTNAAPSDHTPPPNLSKAKKRPAPPPIKKGKKGNRKKKKGSAPATVIAEAVSVGASFKLTPNHITNAFKLVRDQVEELHGKWYSADDWCAILLHHTSFFNTCASQLIPNRLARALNSETAFGGPASLELYTSNECGVYLNRHGQYKVCYYQVIKPGNACINAPRPNGVFHFDTFQRPAVANPMTIPTTPHRSSSQTTNTSQTAAPAADTTNPHIITSPSTTNPITVTSPSPRSSISPPVPTVSPTTHNKHNNHSAAELRAQSWFHSTEAFKLFVPRGCDIEDNDDVEAAVTSAIKNRIKALESGLSGDWWTVVKNGNKKHTELCTWHEQLSIDWKCRYLIIALEEALQKMGKSIGRATWNDCCETAVNTMIRTPWYRTTS